MAGWLNDRELKNNFSWAKTTPFQNDPISPKKKNCIWTELYTELHINLDSIATCTTLQGHNKYLLERFLNGYGFILKKNFR